MKDNPYALSFGKIPNQYIRRDLVINEILDSLNSEDPQENAFKLTGIRGAGKTVTLTAIERELKKDKNWIILINSNALNIAVSRTSYCIAILKG